MTGIVNLDANILLYLQEFVRTPYLTHLFKEITELGNGGIFWLALGACMLIFKKTRIPGVLLLASVIAAGAFGNLVVKTVVDRSRPFLTVPGLHNLVTAHGASFPSGHTTSAFAGAGIIWQTQPRLYGLAAVILAALIGFSRLYLGVHFPTDILGGMLLGLGVAWLVNWLYQRCRNKVPFL